MNGDRAMLAHEGVGDRGGARALRAHQARVVWNEAAAMMIEISSDETGGSWALLVGTSAPRFESGLHHHA